MLQCDLFIILIRFSTFVNIINSISTIINITKNKKKTRTEWKDTYFIEVPTYYVQHSPATHVVNCSNDIGYYCIIIERKKNISIGWKYLYYLPGQRAMW